MDSDEWVTLLGFDDLDALHATGLRLRALRMKPSPPKRAKLTLAQRREKSAAYTAIKRALKSGRLSRRPCSKCGAKGQAHHPRGYARAHQLDVEWLCVSHHWETHRIMRQHARALTGLR